MARMRKAYLRPWNVTTKPKNAGLHKEGMGKLYDHVLKPTHAAAFNDMARLFAIRNERAWNKVKHLLLVRTRMIEQNLHNQLRAKDEFYHITLQNSKQFKLVLFWSSGMSEYHFVKYEDIKGLISISQPYLSRKAAMDAYLVHRDIFWLDFIRIPV